MTTTDNSTVYNNPTEHIGQIAQSEISVSLTSSMIFDVTNTSTHKVNFSAAVIDMNGTLNLVEIGYKSSEHTHHS